MRLRLPFALAAACSAAGLLAAAAPAAVTSSGGIVAPGQPKVSDVVCVTRCVSGHRAQRPALRDRL
jgi:hypothetical protein